MTQTTKAAFSLEDINFANLSDLKIDIFVKDRTTWGRRFTITYDGKTSEQVVFNDIFKKFQKMVITEGNIENLNKAKAFLATLKQSETAAAAEYESKGDVYKFLTWISRLISSGSHSDNMDSLEADILNKLNDLDYDKNMEKINTSIRIHGRKDLLLQSFAQKYLLTNNLDLASKLIHQMDEHKDALYVQLAEAYIAQNNPDDAFDVVFCEIYSSEKKDALYEKIGQLCLGNDDKALLMFKVALRIQKTSVRDDLLFQTAKVCVKKGDPEKAEAIMSNRSTDLDGPANYRFWLDVSDAYNIKGDMYNSVRTRDMVVF